MRYARHLLPRDQREWGAGMEAELHSITDNAAALRWALGAWRAAWWARARMICGSPVAHIALALVIAFEFEGELIKAATMGHEHPAGAGSVVVWTVCGLLFVLAGVQLTRKRASSPWLFLAAIIVQRLSGSLPLPVAARALDSLAVPLVAFFVLLVRTYSGSRAHNFNWRWRAS